MFFSWDCTVLFSAVLWTMFVNGYSDFIVRPIDTEVRVGDSVHLDCSTSDSQAGANWYHSPADEEIVTSRIVYFEGNVYCPYDKRFHIERDTRFGSYNLMIKRVRLQDAGFYVCQSGGINKSTIAQLTVIDKDPICQSNIDRKGFLGPNTCDLDPEEIHVLCSINYKGNISPRLQLTRVKNRNEVSVNESLLSCYSSAGRVSCKYTTTGDIDMDGSYFICHSEMSETTHLKCRTSVVKVIVAIKSTITIEKNIGDTVTCSSDDYSGVCKYQWLHYNYINEVLVSSSRQLELDLYGWYRCEAECYFKGIQCSFDVMVIKVPFNKTNSVVFCIVLVLCCVVLWGLFHFIWLIGKPRRIRTYFENENEEQDSESEEEMFN